MNNELSHIDGQGKLHMVDVGSKPISEREATAKALVLMKSNTLDMIHEGNLKKGDVFTVAQLAGVMAAKRTAELIPLCHPLMINQAQVEITPDHSLPGIVITSTVSTSAQTGVEMEALTAASIAALTIYDMVKAVDKTLRITDIQLVKKTGGQSGDVILEGS
jgi:cyclic pyranopterin phosphate synthase